MDNAFSSEVTNRINAVSGEANIARAAENALNVRVDTESKARYDEDVLINSSITALQDNKFNKAGGAISGFLQVDNNLEVLGQATMNSYLNFGLLWRVSGSVDGKRLVFQYRKDTESPYKNAVPFISSS